MSTNKEKFLALVTETDHAMLKSIAKRVKNRAALRESQNIAIKVLMKLDELGWSQKDLALAMEVTPQQVNKIVRGKQNLTLETQVKLQQILNIPILASYYEAIEKKRQVKTFESDILPFFPERIPVSGTYVNPSGKAYSIKMTFNKANPQYQKIAS